MRRGWFVATFSESLYSPSNKVVSFATGSWCGRRSDRQRFQQRIAGIEVPKTILQDAVCPIPRFGLSGFRRQAKYALCRPIKRDRPAKRNHEFESTPLRQPVLLFLSLGGVLLEKSILPPSARPLYGAGAAMRLDLSFAGVRWKAP